MPLANVSGGRGRGNGREESLLSTEPGLTGAQSHNLWDQDLSWNQESAAQLTEPPGIHARPGKEKWSTGDGCWVNENNKKPIVTFKPLSEIIIFIFPVFKPRKINCLVTDLVVRPGPTGPVIFFSSYPKTTDLPALYISFAFAYRNGQSFWQKALHVVCTMFSHTLRLTGSPKEFSNTGFAAPTHKDENRVPGRTQEAIC